MEKKLTAQGPKGRQSYTVTLPIEWIKQEGLDKTKTVDMDLVARKIIISAQKRAAGRVVIDAKQYEESFTKVLPGLYRAGVSEIKILLSRDTRVEEILDIIEKKLIGYEVVEQKNDYLMIKDITKESEEDFQVIFRRIFLLLIEYGECADIAQVSALDRNIKKLINYCQRILILRGHAQVSKTPLYYLILDRLEKLKDELNWLLQTTIPKKAQPSGMDDVFLLLRYAYELFYRFEPKSFNTYQHQAYELRNRIIYGKKVERATIHIHNCARILNSLYGDIFTLKFDVR